MLDSMRCSKCRLIQLAAPTCQSCGTPSPRLVIRQASASAPAARRPVAEAPRPTAPPAPPATPHPAAASSPAPFDAEGDRTELVDKPTRASAAVTAVSEVVGDASTERRLTFEGQGGALFGIQIVNVFLTLLTLGIYSFWGKVRVRSYLMSQTEFEGDRFAYHGTGKELYRGAVKAGLVFGGLSALLNASQVMPKGAPQISAVLAAYLGLSLLMPVAIVGARRYRLSRTSWRNIRFAFRGNTGAFIKLFLKGSLLTGLTFGLYYPFFATNQHAFLISNSYFGDKSFGFNGRGRHLFGP
ncbi:MAG TPA: DUF898 family protein, partial [Nitrospiria bacterium]|nr:DUF898 family protein [Nitrospiria bacterium]